MIQVIAWWAAVSEPCAIGRAAERGATEGEHNHGRPHAGDEQAQHLRGQRLGNVVNAVMPVMTSTHSDHGSCAMNSSSIDRARLMRPAPAQSR